LEATFFIAEISPNGDPKINPSDHINWSWNYKIYNATIFGANFHNLVIFFSKTEKNLFKSFLPFF